MPVRPLGDGRFQADVSDKKRGIPRTKRTFRSKKEAKEWEKAVGEEGHKRLLGIRQQRQFGEALAAYLREQASDPAKFDREQGMSAALRWPFLADKKWVRLEQVPLEEVVTHLHHWITDLRLVRRRRYLAGQTYHQRAEAGGLVWYHQPAPESADLPPARVRVTDAALLAELERENEAGEAGGRGPFAAQTLRYRQVIVRKVLGMCWRPWRWTDADLGAEIELLALPAGREVWLTPAQLDTLTSLAPEWFKRAICGAAWIGWRKANVLRLEWSQVVWPVRDSAGNLASLGVIFVPADQTKKRKAIAQPMSERVERLLLECWDHRRGEYVFQVDGRCVADIDFKRRWATLKRRAGIARGFRWHDLRHTWATHLAIGGANGRQLQELGGWKTSAMPARYTHLNVEHLVGAVGMYQKIESATPRTREARNPVQEAE